jgi:NAD(P)H-hydrate epimerase
MTLINEQWVKQHIKHRSEDGHKKSFGHVLVIAGSEGKAGSSVLCAKSALHSGCGMVTAMIPNVAVQVLLEQSPELMYLSPTLLAVEDLANYDAIAIGPGLGFSDIANSNLKFILTHYKGPVVIDADALTMVASEMSLLKANHIVTPHPGEFARLQGFDYNQNNREAQVLDFIEKYPTVLVLKGVNTIVANSLNGILQNTTGNDGMATAGSGDVLTGIIVALCAQGYDLFIAAAIGVYMHGLAGDLAIKEQSKASLVASDIINYLGQIKLTD